MILKRKTKVIQDNLTDGTVKTLDLIETGLGKLDDVPIVCESRFKKTALSYSKPLKKLINKDKKRKS